MKKTLLLFAILFSVVGAWANVVIPTEGHYYVIKNLRSNNYATFAGDNAQLKQEATKTAYAIWYITDVVTIENGIQCKLHNAVTENVYTAYNSFTESGQTAYIKTNPHNSDVVCISTTKDLGSNCWDDQGNHALIGIYNPRQNDHQGTSWTFEDVTSDVVIATNLNYEITDQFGQDCSGNNYKYIALGDDCIAPTEVQNMCAKLSNVIISDGNLTANIVYPFPVSSAEVTNKLMMNGYAANNHNFKMYAKENTKIKVDKDLEPTTANIDNYLWAIYPNLIEGTYTIKNITTGKYIYSNATEREHTDTTLEFSDTATPFKLVKDNWGYSFKVADKDLYLSINSSSTATEQPVGLWSNTHAGSSWNFIPYVVKYTLTDVANNIFTGEYDSWIGFNIEPTFTGIQGYTLENKVWDNANNTFTATINFPFPVSSPEVTNPTLITNGASWSNPNSRKWRVAEVDSIQYVKVQTASVKFSDNNALWAIYPELNGNAFGFKIKSLSTGKFVKASTSADGGTNDVKGSSKPVTLNDEGTIFEYKVRDGSNYHFAYKNDSNQELRLSINSSGDTDVFLGVYNGKHSGNDIAFPTYKDNMTWPNFISSENTLNPLVIAIDRDAKKSFVAQKIPGSSERYVRVTEYSEDPELGYGQWAIYPTLTGNKFGFKIKNIATETYIYANSANTEYPVTLNNDGTTFDFVIGNDSLLAYNDGADTRYLSVPTNDNYGCPVGVSSANEGRKAIIFPEFKRYTVNIGATGYTTLYTPFTVMAEAEAGKKVEVYTIKEDIQPDDTLVHLTQMDAWNSIPANSACILRLTEVDEDGREVKLTSGRVTCVKADDDMVYADWSGNLLKGSYTNSYVEGKAYVLSAPDGPESVGMYWATLNKDSNGATGSTHFKNNSGKAYILAPKDADGNVRFLAFNFGGEETGIIETENENLKMENAEVYDLAGRRVQGAQKGIFIVNGKLVIK